MKFYNQTIKEIESNLETNIETGLSSDIYKKRLEKDGFNELKEPPKKNIFIRFLLHLYDFLTIILMLASILSFVTGEFIEGGLILAIVILNAILGLSQELKAEKSLKDIQNLASPHAKVLRDGIEMEVLSKDLVVGDIVLLDAGDYVPADIRIIQSHNLKIDESALTGETLAVDKTSDIIKQDEVSLGDRTNMGYMSTVVTYGRGIGIVVRCAMDTEIGKIASMLTTSKKEKTPLQLAIDKLSKLLGILSIIITILIFGITVIEMYTLSPTSPTWLDWKDTILGSIALAVAAVPEGLSAIITIILAVGMQKLAKNKAIMKTLPAVETLGSTSIICSDKTGTLTQNKMTVTKIFIDNEILDCKNLKLNNNIKNLITYSILVNDAKISINEDKTYNKLGDQTEIALLNLALDNNIDPISITNKYPRLFELSFDSDRKMMSTLHTIDNKLLSIVKGAPDVMLSKCINSKEEIEMFEMANTKMTEMSLRVLAVGYKNVSKKDTYTFNDLEDSITLIGLVGMIDPPRDEVKDAIKQAYDAGIKTIMITGDHKNTAVAIARDLNIITSDIDGALTGLELDKLSDEEFLDKIDNIKVYARVSPENKVRIVNTFKQKGNIVAMTGDGVNDAPALKNANIGVAMGITGTEVSKGAADMVLVDDNFTTIISAVSEGRKIFSNIKKSIFFLLSSNIGEIIAIFLATIFGAIIFKDSKLPLGAIHLLWINLVTDSLMAIGLGLEPKELDIMKNKPRNPKESFFANKGGLKIALEGLMIGIIAFSAYLLGYLLADTSNAVRYNLTAIKYQERVATTMTFMVLAMSVLVHAFNLRSFKHSIFKLKQNYFLLFSFIGTIIVQMLVFVIPGINTTIFKLVTPSEIGYKLWIVIIVFTLLPLIIGEISKIFIRKFSKK